jgi:peroxiredoxin
VPAPASSRAVPSFQFAACAGRAAALLAACTSLTLPFFTPTSGVSAGTYNPDRVIGDVVPAWKDLPGTDGRLHSWNDVADRAAVVVAFTCNSCPYAVDYERRIDDLARKHAGKGARVAVVAINSNLIPEDAPEAMKRRAEERGFAFPYLFDGSQEVAKSFGAVRTPEFFVLDRQRRIVYMGAFDDATKPEDVTKRHVEDAIDALLAGRDVTVKETAPVGCLIRFDRKRSRP